MGALCEIPAMNDRFHALESPAVPASSFMAGTLEGAVEAAAGSRARET